MDWDLIYRERAKKREAERERYLAMSDGEAEKLPVSERYQRMRYQREIEAEKWLEEERRKIKVATPIAKKYKKHYGSTKTKINFGWKD